MQFSMIEEKDESKIQRLFRRSWTVRILKNTYAPITVTILALLLCLACLYLFINAERWILKEKVVTTGDFTFVRTALASDLPKTTQDKIRAAFGVHADTFLKIATAESGQQAGNKGYNCIYGGKSMACKPEDRAKAWSVDCGLLMINVNGTICPAELFDIDLNIKAAQGKFARQNFKAWSVCKTKVKCK